jgi:transcription antitermination protein NusB
MTDDAPTPPARSASRNRHLTSSSGRSRARVFAVQALYQLLVGQQALSSIQSYTSELSGFHKADADYFQRLLEGCEAQASDLDARFAPFLDRPMDQLSPIEHAVLRMGTYELLHSVDVPWRVVINESIELAKTFGGTDGHKYVNAVLNEVARLTREAEYAHDVAQGLARG